MGRHPQSERTASDEHSRRLPSTRDFALCDLFAVAITRKTAPMREDTRSSSKSNDSASERMKVQPEKPEPEADASIRRTTEKNKPSSEHHSKQGKLPLYPTYQTTLPHRPRPPTPTPNQRPHSTLPPPAHPPGPKTEHTPSPPPNNNPLLFATLIRQLHTTRSSFNAHKRAYSQLKTHHHKALRTFCTGRYSNWATADTNISHRLRAVSRALRQERRSERQIVHKLEVLEESLKARGCGVDGWRRRSGVERWMVD